MQEPALQPEEVTRLPLRALGLKPGMSLQTRRLAHGARKQESQYFGAIEGKGVMVGALGTDGEACDLTVGDICLVRGFTGQYEFSFPSKVLQNFEQPFAYALLAYPNAVDARLVRHSMRVKGSWPCSVSIPLPDGTSQPVQTTLVDISVSGAMVKAPAPLAAVGTELNVTLSVHVEGAPLDLYLRAGVCHSNRASYEDAYFVGLAFKGQTQQDKLVLTYLTQGS